MASGAEASVGNNHLVGAVVDAWQLWPDLPNAICYREAWAVAPGREPTLKQQCLLGLVVWLPSCGVKSPARDKKERGMRDSELTPAARTIGKRIISVDDESGEVRLGFVAVAGFTNRHGTVGGGYLAAMLESTAAAPLLNELHDDLSAVTTELRIRMTGFLRRERGPDVGHECTKVQYPYGRRVLRLRSRN